MATPWRPQNQPAPTTVTSGSASNPSVPSWNPKNQPAPSTVKETEPVVTG